MTSVASSKYRVSVSRTSSASRSAANGVNPTRSANRTETSRISATGASAGAAAADSPFDAPGPATTAVPGAPGAAPWRPVPHSLQNRAVGAFVVPQLGHVPDSFIAQPLQNLAPLGFSVPQFEQITGVAPAHDG